MAKIGWQHKLKFKIRYNMRSLVSLIRKHSPVGKARPSGVYSKSGKLYKYRRLYTPGKLKKHWKWKAGSVHLDPKLRDIIVESPLIQAYVQEYGARIPSYRSPRDKIMMFNIGSIGIFTKYRKGFTIKPQYYVHKAFFEWFKKENSIKVEMVGK